MNDSALQRLNWSEVLSSGRPSAIVHFHWIDVPKLPQFVAISGGIFGILFCGFSCFGAVAIIQLFYRCPHLRTVSNLLVLNLTVADFMLSSGNIPLYIVSSFYGHWVFGTIGCYAYAFVGSCTSFVSINTLAAIALDRCLVIVKGLPWKGRLSGKALLRSVAFIWIYSILWASTPFFGFGRYILEGTNTSCSFDFLTRDSNNKIYVLSIFAAHFAIPLVTIVVSYTLIYRAILEHKREFKIASRVFGEQDRPLQISKRSKQSVMNEARIARVALIVISVFCLSWAPYACIALIGLFGDQSLITRLSVGIPCVLAKFSTVLNPLIYALLHPNFRKSLLQITSLQFSRSETLQQRFTHVKSSVKLQKSLSSLTT